MGVNKASPLLNSSAVLIGAAITKTEVFLEILLAIMKLKVTES